MTDDAPTPRKIWRRGQHGWPAGFPVVQLPNVPLLAALAGWLVAALTGGLVHACARATFYTSLAAWAWKELEDGVNWARRAIGAAALIFVIAKIAEALPDLARRHRAMGCRTRRVRLRRIRRSPAI